MYKSIITIIMFIYVYINISLYFFYFSDNDFKVLKINENNFSILFIESIKRYNLRLLYINNLYKRIHNVHGINKAIIVLLFYKEIRKFIDRNLSFLKNKYHDKLIFFVTNYTTTVEEYRNIAYNIIDITDIFFKFPYDFNQSQYNSTYRKRGIWNYQHMCKFFFIDIFYHPALYDVELYMRLDSESILNTSVNLFNYMNKSTVYMHNNVFNDADFVVKELKNFTISLVKALRVDIKDYDNYKNIFKRSVLSYYNNFEICRVSFFRSKNMLIFQTLVDYSYGQFIYRWGDAPLRYISLSLYAEKYQKISLPKRTKYCHKNC